jgi:hypothetical protein
MCAHTIIIRIIPGIFNHHTKGLRQTINFLRRRCVVFDRDEREHAIGARRDVFQNGGKRNVVAQIERHTVHARAVVGGKFRH